MPRRNAFQDLSFESANIGQSPPGGVIPTLEAMPGWTTNNFDAGYVAYDDLAVGSLCISIHDGKGGSVPWDFNPLQGSYSVMLQDGSATWGNTWNASISQVGDVPAYARSLMFMTDTPAYLNDLVVSLNGTVIPMQVYSVGGTINSGYMFGPVETLAGDISAFAGSTNVELQFEELDNNPLDLANTPYVNLDAITFSPTVVPEPSSLALLAIGLLSLAGYCWRRRNRPT